MARAGTAVDERIECVAIGATVAGERLLAVATPTYRAVSIGTNRFRFARTYRPTWAVVSGCLLAPTLVGLLFFLVRRAESWDAVVEEDHRSVTLRVQGEVLGSVMTGLHQAAAWGPDPAPPTSYPDAPPMPFPSAPPVSPAWRPDTVPPGALSMGPPGGPATAMSPPWRSAASSDPAGRQQWSTVPSQPPQPVPPPPPPVSPASPLPPNTAPSNPAGQPGEEHPAAAAVVDERTSFAGSIRPTAPISPLATVTLCFDTGERHVLGTSLLVGRDPQAAAHLSEGPAPDLLAIADPDRSVSKTHLSVRRDGTHVLVTDRGSTNGTAVIDPQGHLEPAMASEPVRVAIGSTVRFGKRSFLVVEDIP